MLTWGVCAGGACQIYGAEIGAGGLIAFSACAGADLGCILCAGADWAGRGCPGSGCADAGLAGAGIAGSGIAGAGCGGWTFRMRIEARLRVSFLLDPFFNAGEVIISLLPTVAG